MNNPGIDLIIRLKNGYLAHKMQITSPHSGFRVSILNKLKDLGYIDNYTVEGDKVKNINIVLKYQEGIAAFGNVKVYSKPGRRWYTQAKEIKPVKSTLGVTLLSAPEGILTDKEAREQKIGGELLFSIW